MPRGPRIANALFGPLRFPEVDMKRETSLLGVLILSFLTTPLLLAQGNQSDTRPVLPSEILGPQLIAWSQAQRPQPVPQPLPPPARPTAQPDPQPEQPASPPLQQQQQPAAQTFSGTIVKDGGTYVLKVSRDSSYRLDDQDKAKQYEGKQVRIAGTLDANTNSIHVTSIELVS
jgi:hypothetical protein